MLDGAKVSITSENGYSNADVEVKGGEIILNNLEPGKYTVVETQAPDGYQIDIEPRTVEVLWGKVATVTIPNGAIPEPKASLGLIKTNEDGSARVSGAVIRVWNDEGYSKNVVTNSNGEIVLDDLDIGNYYYQEVSAPYGYLLNSTVHNLTFSEGGENLSCSESIKNSEPTGTLSVTKEDDITGNIIRTDNIYHHGDASIAGAVYTLYATSQITNVARNITYYNAGDEIATFTFNERGEATVQVVSKSSKSKVRASGSTLMGLPMGRYHVKETSIPKRI